MIKIIFLSDTHLGFDYPIRPRIKRERRGFSFFRNFEKVLDYAISEKIQMIIHGGDLFFRSKLPQQIVTKVYSILLEFAQNNIPIFLIPGNHERSVFPESIFLNHPNIFIFDKPYTFFLNLSNNKLGVSGFPYERENVRNKIKDLILQTEHDREYADIKLLCFHQAVEGSKVKNYTFRYGNDVIKKNDLPFDFHAILSGHIHRRQILWIGNNDKKLPLIYSGSTERTSLAEKNEDKGFFVLEFRQLCNGWRLVDSRFNKMETTPID